MKDIKDRIKILIGYDGSECADAAIDDLQTAGLPERADAVVLSVMENWLPPPSSLESVEGWDHPAETRMVAAKGVARLQRLRPEWEITPEIAIGSPASSILEKADEWKPDLIVVGSHGRTAAGRFFFGSVSQKLAHEAHCTVRIARGRAKPESDPVRILIGVDGSKGAEAAIRDVASRHWPAGSEARIVNACWRIPPTTSQHMLVQIADWIRAENTRVKAMVDAAFTRLKDAGLKTSVLVREEDPRALLLQEAEGWDADCIYMGAKGMGRMERFLIGSVSSSIAARAHCSVEIVRGESAV